MLFIVTDKVENVGDELSIVINYGKLRKLYNNDGMLQHVIPV